MKPVATLPGFALLLCFLLATYTSKRESIEPPFPPFLSSIRFLEGFILKELQEYFSCFTKYKIIFLFLPLSLHVILFLSLLLHPRNVNRPLRGKERKKNVQPPSTLHFSGRFFVVLQIC